MRACKDCRHSKLETLGDYCNRALICKNELSRKQCCHGDFEFKMCAWMRSTEGYCGENGDLFQPRLSWRQRLLSVFRGP
jgi:hypothetical protein